MDDGSNSGVNRHSHRKREYEHKMTVINAVMVCIGFLVFLQTLVFNIAVDAFMRGDDQLVVPTLFISGLCLAGSCWLLRGIYRF